MKVFVCIMFAVLLAGCAAPPQRSVAGAATTPLSDLNLLRAEVPPVLQSALKAPYAVPRDQSCAALAASIRELDDVLGPDFDHLRKEPEPTLSERGATEAEKSLLDAIRRTAEGLVPYRSWVRKLSGAEQHEKFVASTVAAGNARRAFLKGLRSARHCGVM